MSVLDRFSEISSKIYMDGKFYKSQSTESIDVIDPATENKIGEIPETSQSEIDEVVFIANKAQKAWNQKSPLDRSHVLHEVANKMGEMAPLFAEALTREMGKPYKESMDEVHWSIHNIRFYAEMGRGETGKVIGSAVEGQFHYTLKQPLGTCVLILPFNYPMVLLAWEASAALAAGNAVVLKPAEQTPYSICVLMELIADLLPPGVVNVVQGYGVEAGKPLASSNRVKKIGFTGETTTGRLILQYASENLIPVTLELGGKSPNIFFKDIMNGGDEYLSRCVEGFLHAYFNQGEVCTCPSRAVVHEDIYEPFMEMVKKRVSVLNCGDPFDLNTQVGAQASSEQFDKIMSYLDVGKQ